MKKNTVIDYITFSEFITLVKQEIKAYDSQGYINDGDLIPKAMWCNEKLGIRVHDVKQAILPVEHNKADLPKDFYKVFYLTALEMTNTTVTKWTNPWNNSQDRTTSYDASYEEGCFQGANIIKVIYKKQEQNISQSYHHWTDIRLNNKSFGYVGSPCINNNSRHTADIFKEEGYIEFGFQTGEVYMMYVADMLSEEGEVMVPFHPIITPWYVWTCVMQVITSMIFDTDEDLNKLKMQKELAQDELNKAWINCWNFCNSKDFMQWQQDRKNQEIQWWNKWFKRVL